MRLRTIDSALESINARYQEQQREELFLVDAFLRALGWSKCDTASIEPADSDPPDILLKISATSLGVEVTRWIPWDQGKLVRGDQIVEGLQERVRRRCIKTRARANFVVVAQDGATEDEIERATDALVAFLATHDVSQEDRILRVHDGTFELTYVPARGSFGPQGEYENGIRIADATGRDITDRWKRLRRLVEQKKLKHNQRTDILLISGPPVTDEELRRTHAVVEGVGLPHSGAYYLCVIRDQHGNTRAGVHAIRHHPLLKP